MTWKDDLLREYVDRKALSKGTYTLAGGGVSDFYIDGRRVTTSPRGLRAIVKGMIDGGVGRDDAAQPRLMVAPAISGIPVVTALALALDRPYVIDRGRPKTHGLAKRFEGWMDDGIACVVVDDLITVGSTLVQTVEGLRELGHDVKDAFVVVDREEGGAAALASINVNLHSLLTQRELRSVLAGI